MADGVPAALLARVPCSSVLSEILSGFSDTAPQATADVLHAELKSAAASVNAVVASLCGLPSLHPEGGELTVIIPVVCFSMAGHVHTSTVLGDTLAVFRVAREPALSVSCAVVYLMEGRLKRLKFARGSLARIGLSTPDPCLSAVSVFDEDVFASTPGSRAVRLAPTSAASDSIASVLLSFQQPPQCEEEAPASVTDVTKSVSDVARWLPSKGEGTIGFPAALFPKVPTWSAATFAVNLVFDTNVVPHAAMAAYLSTLQALL